MIDPYEPVSLSKSEYYEQCDLPSDGEAVGIEFVDEITGEIAFVVEDSGNPYAWVEGLDDATVDLESWR